MISQREWHEEEGDTSGETTVSIREFRGNGRARYMMRDRIADDQDPDYLMPNFDTGTWTSYDGDLPVRDVTLTWDTDEYIPSGLTRYHLGLAQVSFDGSPSADDVKYFHADHLGTTRAMTATPDGPEGPPETPTTASPRIVYTAFGEPVSVNGTPGAPTPTDTRYQYVGQHGYETFAGLPYQHVGHRWYDASTGRFLQRDPIGLDGGMNVYAYVNASPLDGVDPQGLDRWYHRENAHSYVYFRNADGTWTRYSFGPGSSNWFYGPGKITPETQGVELPKNAERYPSTPAQDSADQAAIEKQRKAPPTYSFPGIRGQNCIEWARRWATYREPKMEWLRGGFSRLLD